MKKWKSVLDACHSIQYQVQRTPNISRIDRSSIDSEAQKNKKIIIDLFQHEDMKDYNLIGFIRDNARNIEDWQKDLMTMVEKRSRNFIPQAKTKIMNEGWAVTIHEKIKHDLKLPDAYHLAFIKSHNQVRTPNAWIYKSISSRTHYV